MVLPSFLMKVLLGTSTIIPKVSFSIISTTKIPISIKQEQEWSKPRRERAKLLTVVHIVKVMNWWLPVNWFLNSGSNWQEAESFLRQFNLHKWLTNLNFYTPVAQSWFLDNRQIILRYEHRYELVMFEVSLFLFFLYIQQLKLFY